MDITLNRFKSTSNGTFGILRVGDRKFYSIEKPWDNNQPFESCVPASDYSLVPHKSDKYGEVLCLVNASIGVTRYRERGTKRYACLIHVGNWQKDVLGCIALGTDADESMVINSRQAIKDFYETVDPNQIHQITINWKEK